MTAEIIIGLVIYCLVAAVMFGIGFTQYRSTKPVGFYSGEKPPKESELSDVVGWNKEHGMMWLLYSGIIIISYLLGLPLFDSIWCVVPMCGGIILPLPLMIWYHHKLMKKYKK